MYLSICLTICPQIHIEISLIPGFSPCINYQVIETNQIIPYIPCAFNYLSVYLLIYLFLFSHRCTYVFCTSRLHNQHHIQLSMSRWYERICFCQGTVHIFRYSLHHTIHCHKLLNENICFQYSIIDLYNRE